MTGRFVVACTLAALLCGIGVAVAAPSKTLVAIDFEVTDKRFTAHRPAEQLDDLKKRAGEAIARALNSQAGFLEFVAADSADYALHVLLGRAENSSAAGPAELGFHLSLSGPDVRPDVRGYVLFREKQFYSEPLGPVENVVREIEEAMRKANIDALVGGVLRHVAIAETGDFFQNPLGWVLHKDRGLLCLDVDSRIHVVSIFPHGPFRVTKPLPASVQQVEGTNEIVSFALEHEFEDSALADTLRSISAADLTVQQSYVVEYRRFCPARVSGTAVDFSGAGSSP